jgi:signal transduction histidine kinase
VTEPLSEQQLAEIRGRETAATKGPWGTYDDGTGRIDIAADLEDTGHGYTCRRGIAQTDDDPIDNDPTHADWDEDTDLAQSEADAQFIAHARTDVPTLLAEIDRLQAERHTTNEALDDAVAAIRAKDQRIAELEQQLAAAVRRDITSPLYTILRHGDMSDQVRREIADLLVDATEGGGR